MMDFNSTFFSGLACGLCIGALFINRKFLLYRFANSAPKSGSAKGKSESTSSIRKKIKKATEEYKLVLVVRNDLHMGKGKLAAQCSHAAVGAYSKALKSDPDALEMWEYGGQAKIAVKVESEDELIKIFDAAKKAGLITSMIRDAGRTQIEPNTRTVLGVGPAPKSEIDKVTGHLKLV